MQLLLFLSPRVPSTRYILCSSKKECLLDLGLGQQSESEFKYTLLIYISSHIHADNITAIEDFECQETLAETCNLDDLERTGLSRLSLKTGTIRRLSNHVNTSSEACQEQCEMILLGDKTPKEKTLQRRRKQCSCFCFYHQECLPPGIYLSLIHI